MQKSIYRVENQEACFLLRSLREAAGITQADLAARFGHLQSFVSTVERGLVRLDVIQVREWCLGCGTTFPAFAEALEARIKTLPAPVRSKVRRKAAARPRK